MQGKKEQEAVSKVFGVPRLAFEPSHTAVILQGCLYFCSSRWQINEFHES